MRRYLFGTFAVAAALVILCFGIVLFVPSPIPAEYWVRELIVLKESLAQSYASPRLLFLGGSATLFGIDAREVNAESGIPAFNFGLYAGMRLDRILSIGAAAARPNDTIILSLEPSFSECGQETWTNGQVENALAWDREYFDRLPLATRMRAVFAAHNFFLLALDVGWDKIDALRHPERYARRALALAPSDTVLAEYRSGEKRTKDFAYSAFNIDDHGDMLNTEGAHYDGPAAAADVPGRVCGDIVSTLRDFVRLMDSRHVRVVIAHTPYIIDDEPSADWRAAEQEFETDLEPTGAQILDRRDELFFPRADFFNTELHLNEMGRRERTSILMADLRARGLVP